MARPRPVHALVRPSRPEAVAPCGPSLGAALKPAVKQRNKTEKYHKNINKRGNVPQTFKPKEKFAVGPLLIGASPMDCVCSLLVRPAPLASRAALRTLLKRGEKRPPVSAQPGASPPELTLAAARYDFSRLCTPGFFLFVVVGSSFLQLIRTTREMKPPPRV